MRAVLVGISVLDGFLLVWWSWAAHLLEKAVEQQRQKQQQIVESWQLGAEACHIAVVTVAAVNSDTWSSVALTIGVTAKRLVWAWLHHPTWQTDRNRSHLLWFTQTSQFNLVKIVPIIKLPWLQLGYKALILFHSYFLIFVINFTLTCGCPLYVHYKPGITAIILLFDDWIFYVKFSFPAEHVCAGLN